MLAKRVIPCMLTKGQILVKGKQFQPWRTIGHAKQAAMIHARRGVDELVVFDVAATAEGRGPDLDLVRELSEECFIPITYGGGVRSLGQIDALLRAGADKVAIGAALCEPGLVEAAADRFGGQAIVAIVNAHRPEQGLACAKIAESKGAGEILLQSVERDGMMGGYDLDLIRAVTKCVRVPVIASCGAGSYEHLNEAFAAGADACAVGAFFCFEDATPRGAAQYLAKKGWEVRA